MPVITVIGSLNVDMVTRAVRVPNAGETVQAKAFEVGWGGKGANQAVAAARLSRSKDTLKSESDTTVRMIGAVGKDVFGPQLVKSMEKDGIDMQGVQLLEGQETGTATILVEESTGENRILVTPGANFELGYSEVDYGNVAIFQLESPMDLVSWTPRTARPPTQCPSLLNIMSKIPLNLVFPNSRLILINFWKFIDVHLELETTIPVCNSYTSDKSGHRRSSFILAKRMRKEPTLSSILLPRPKSQLAPLTKKSAPSL